MNYSENVVQQIIDEGSCLVKVTPENKKEVSSLVKEIKEDGTVRVVPWSCGKTKYILFVDTLGETNKSESKVLAFKKKIA